MLAVLCSALLSQSETPAEALLTKLNMTMIQARTVSATLVVNPDKDGGTKFSLAMQKPGSYHLASPSQIIVSNGKEGYMVFGKDYYRSPAPESQLAPFLCVGLEGFFPAGRETYKAESFTEVEYAGQKARKLMLSKKGVDGMKWFVYLTPNHRPLGWEQVAGDYSKAIISARYDNLVLDGPVDAKQFDWTPPVGYTEKKPVEQRLYLEPNSPAPAIKSKIVGGRDWDLLASAKKAKVTLLNFWFVGCAPCREEFPVLDRWYRKNKDKGLQIVAVNRGDSRDSILSFLQEKQIAIPSISDDAASSICTSYRVEVFPVTYVIDPEGRVVTSVEGKDLKRLQEILKVYGFDVTI